MIERHIQMSDGQQLTLVEMVDDLSVEGWEETGVRIRLYDGSESDLVVAETDGGPSISAKVSCEIRVPRHVPVTIRQVLGNLKVEELRTVNAEQVRGNLKLEEVESAVAAEVYGNLKAAEIASLRVPGTVHGNAALKEISSIDLQNVRGDLQAKEAGRLRVSRVGGNLLAKEIGESVDADQVGGNARLKEIAGSVTIAQVAGNLSARDLTGGARVERIGGNVAYAGALGRGRSYHFRAGGNAVVSLPEDSHVHVTLVAGGLVASAAKLSGEERQANRLSGTLGDGGTELVVEAGGNAALSSGGGEPGADLGEEISRQVEASLSAIDLEAVSRQVGEEMEQAISRLRVKLEGVDWDRIGRRAQGRLQAAIERMQGDMERAAERAARHQERLARRAEKEAENRQRSQERRMQGAGDSVGFAAGAGTASKASEAAEEPATAEAAPSLDRERLAVLKMVEQGQITPEEGDMLLAALE